MNPAAKLSMFNPKASKNSFATEIFTPKALQSPLWWPDKLDNLEGEPLVMCATPSHFLRKIKSLRNQENQHLLGSSFMTCSAGTALGHPLVL
jgi:hypothetical protein